MPLLKVEPLAAVIPPAKLVAGFCPERFQAPPELILTAPVNVRVPVEPPDVLIVPVMEEIPVTVKAKLPIVSVPAVRVKFASAVTAAEFVQPPPEPFKVRASKFPVPGVMVKPVPVAVKVVV